MQGGRTAFVGISLSMGLSNIRCAIDCKKGRDMIREVTELFLCCFDRLMYDPYEKVVYDYLGGLADLKKAKVCIYFCFFVFKTVIFTAFIDVL